MSFLAANDAILKLVGAELPVGQMLVVRGAALCTFLTLGCWIGRQKVSFSGLLHPWCVLRGVAEIIATYLFISSLALLPIALASTLVFSFPIILTAVSGPVFGERVGPWRWGAVLAGFVGVLVVTAPGTGSWQPALALPLGAAVFVAVRDVSTRFVAPHISDGSVTLTSAITVIIGGLASLPFGWAPLSVHAVSWLTLGGLIIAISFFTYVMAVRTGELSLIAPVQYIVILWALIYGLVFWNEVPGLRELVGGAIIIGSGLLILHREKVQHDRLAAQHEQKAGTE
ncbi:MAG: DMT family transporter [Alphaproteobacteria bacterium]|nr:DMT family transporter [Alphaproteobacteria bacterium]